MKKILSVVFCSVLMTFSVYAQNQHPEKEPKTPEEKAQKQSTRLTKELSLTADQANQVKAIILSREQKKDEIKTKYQNAPDKKAQHQEMENLKTTSEAELEKVLTPEQFTKYKAKKEEKQQNKPKGKGKTTK